MRNIFLGNTPISREPLVRISRNLPPQLSPQSLFTHGKINLSMSKLISPRQNQFHHSKINFAAAWIIWFISNGLLMWIGHRKETWKLPSHFTLYGLPCPHYTRKCAVEAHYFHSSSNTCWVMEPRGTPPCWIDSHSTLRANATWASLPWRNWFCCGEINFAVHKLILPWVKRLLCVCKVLNRV